jgi:hypothetical protein
MVNQLEVAYSSTGEIRKRQISGWISRMVSGGIQSKRSHGTMRSRVPVAVGELQPTTGGAREVKAAEREVSASDDHLWLPWHKAQGRPAPLTVHRFPEFGPPSGDEWRRSTVWRRQLVRL